MRADLAHFPLLREGGMCTTIELSATRLIPNHDYVVHPFIIKDYPVRQTPLSTIVLPY